MYIQTHSLDHKQLLIIEIENHYSSSPSLKSTTSTPQQNTGNGFNESPIFLPNIHSNNNNNNNQDYDVSKSYKQNNKLDDVDEIKIEDTISQFSGLLSNSKSVNKTRDFNSSQIQPLDSHINYINFSSDKDPDISTSNDDKFQNAIVVGDDDFNINSAEPFSNSVNSAPPIINTNSRDQTTPSTSSSNSIDIGTYSGSELRLRRRGNEHHSSGNNSRRLYRNNYGSNNVKVKNKKPLISKSANKIGVSRSPFPTNSKPFEKPKESLETCFNQEANMLGLNSLVRLLRHHPSIVLGQLHSIIVALGQQIRNLRSQVARTACQVSAEMFLILKRNVELDLEELSGPLFHRSADTNRFIRADCNDALDNMVDNVGHAKAVSVIISKGIMHQNATVRAVAARLLLRLSEKVGPEKLLSLPKEIREKMLLSGANLLTEGKLETRAFAKQVFRIWSSHPSFNNLLLEAVPPNIMRQISKTLISIKS
ncbi:hypothetical protein Phum_PHUM609440 [Pediculus humanus corporis]|uniref:TOG domain-containing protein n=1 Tax=Pediculus humanus subsp. corporis TaxID=121224 RepID=E0W3S6_PEDHC|nr:uncharacterized protein Phum_PHUM609440 [Pediculus humanus corporis]EEB20282.1 hypothetical protein Phum_PHUM609440 [Pediculus humanus corporis]